MIRRYRSRFCNALIFHLAEKEEQNQSPAMQPRANGKRAGDHPSDAGDAR